MRGPLERADGDDGDDEGVTTGVGSDESWEEGEEEAEDERAGVPCLGEGMWNGVLGGLSHACVSLSLEKTSLC